MRRSAFRPRTELASVPDAQTQSQAHSDVGAKGAGANGGRGGELALGVAEAEAVQRDPARAQVLTRQWSEVLAELVGVSAAVGIFASAAAYWSVRTAVSIVSGVLAGRQRAY